MATRLVATGAATMEAVALPAEECMAAALVATQLKLTLPLAPGV